MAKKIKLREYASTSTDYQIASYSLKIIKIRAEIDEIFKRVLSENKKREDQPMYDTSKGKLSEDKWNEILEVWAELERDDILTD